MLVPGAAHAGALHAVREARLRSAVGSLSITQTRCPPNSADCGRLGLTMTFDSGRHPHIRRTRGLRGFALGVRASGRGRGQCAAESPAVTVTAPDGSMQLLGGAQRLDPLSFAATRIFIGVGRRGARWAWREPVAPAYRCVYFGDPGAPLALPRSVAIPASGWIPRRVLRRRHFVVKISGSRAWTRQAADGTSVKSLARWSLRLRYSR